MQSIEAYPLHWPPHRKRTAFRTRAAFHRKVEKRYTNSENTYQVKESLTIADSRDRLYAELEKFGASKVIISSNLRLKIDGTPYGADQSNPADPGIAVYFQLKNQPHCLSCDTWDRAADNLAAIAKHVEAMRGQLRWGVADVASMFSGFKALPNAIITPAPMTVDEAALFMARQMAPDYPPLIIVQSTDNFKGAYRKLVLKLHPDTGGGDSSWNEFQRAADVLKQHHGIA